DALGERRIPLNEPIGVAVFIVLEVEARRHRGSHQRKAPARNQATALPRSSGDHDLRAVSGAKIVSENHQATSSIGMKLEHLDRVAEVEVKHFVGREAVQSRE